MNLDPPLNDHLSTKTQDAVKNPYVLGAEGRKEWNDRYMNLANSIRTWQIAFFSSIVVLTVCVVGLAKKSNDSIIKPFMVETNNGVPIAIRTMQSVQASDKKLVQYAVDQFIINARTIIKDTEAQKNILNKVYAYAADDTLGYLQEYYQKNNPIELSMHYTTAIKIINSLPISNNTWQVDWEEIKYKSEAGGILEKSRWLALITYHLGSVEPKFIDDNPFGFYFTHITWSQNHSEEEAKL